MSLVIFCLLFSVDYVPFKGEIIWCLSLTAWLIYQGIDYFYHTKIFSWKSLSPSQLASPAQRGNGCFDFYHYSLVSCSKSYMNEIIWYTLFLHLVHSCGYEHRLGSFCWVVAHCLNTPQLWVDIKKNFRNKTAMIILLSGLLVVVDTSFISLVSVNWSD